VKSEKENETGHVWVLDTETKGTGANMVPLERVLRKPSGGDAVPGFVFRKLERKPEQPEPREPYRFKILDVMTRQPLADDVDAHDAIRALEPVRSIVDVSIFVWEPEEERWRLLTYDEGRLLWERRGRVDEPAEA
jgi:hypothetical protein